MKRNHAAIGIPWLALLAAVGMATFPTMGVPAEDPQAERDSLRLESEARRQQEMARQDMENRERAQAEALRGQEDAIRRMEATRARIEANSQQITQQTLDQARASSYPNNAVIVRTAPAPAGADRARPDDVVSGMSFASLSEQLGSYFGTQSGVLVVHAGAGAPFGLQDGDVILAVDGRTPVDGPHAATILRSYRPGEPVKLQVQRHGKAVNLDVTAPGQRSNLR